MGRKKLEKFAEFTAMSNSFEFATDMKGEWNKKYFKNNNPIVLELGCGKGDYSLGLAELWPNKNFIAIDIQGERMWIGSKAAAGKQLDNIAFLRIYIDHIEEYFSKAEVDEIWITFPDPHPKRGKVKKRLTSPLFLDRYFNILKKNGYINLKTDHQALFDYSLDLLAERGVKPNLVIRDVHAQKELEPFLQITTDFERRFMNGGKPICYMKFNLTR